MACCCAAVAQPTEEQEQDPQRVIPKLGSSTMYCKSKCLVRAKIKGAPALLPHCLLGLLGWLGLACIGWGPLFVPCRLWRNGTAITADCHWRTLFKTPCSTSQPSFHLSHQDHPGPPVHRGILRWDVVSAFQKSSAGAALLGYPSGQIPQFNPIQCSPITNRYIVYELTGACLQRYALCIHFFESKVDVSRMCGLFKARRCRHFRASSG